MRHLLLTLALLSIAAEADAARFTLTFDGQVRHIAGSGPSLSSLGLARYSPLHYEVLVDTDAQAFWLQGGDVFPIVDWWYAPDEYSHYYYSELLAQPYPTPGSFSGSWVENFIGTEEASPAFSCLVGRLFVGVDQLEIGACGGVPTWSVGTAVQSAHRWRDLTSNEDIRVYGDLTVTEVTPLAEPSTAALAALSVALLALRNRTDLVSGQRSWRAREAPSATSAIASSASEPSSGSVTCASNA